MAQLNRLRGHRMFEPLYRRWGRADVVEDRDRLNRCADWTCFDYRGVPVVDVS